MELMKIRMSSNSHSMFTKPSEAHVQSTCSEWSLSLVKQVAVKTLVFTFFTFCIWNGDYCVLCIDATAV